MSTDDEMLYHVDERDEVVGSRRRGDVHRLGLLHRSVHVLVFNSFGDVFLQKRATHKDSNPGLWDTSAAGHVDFGESYDACVIRELAEELRIDVGEPPEFVLKVAASEQTGGEFVQVYRLVWDQAIDPNPDEITAGAWFGAEELENWLLSRPEDLTPSFRCLWRLYRSRQARTP